MALSSLSRSAVLLHFTTLHRHHVHHPRALLLPFRLVSLRHGATNTRPRSSTLPKRPVLPSLALRTQHEHEAGAPASCPLHA
jgi:hypothetical protein